MQEPKAGRQIVSRGEYVFRKALASCLSFWVFACVSLVAIGILTFRVCAFRPLSYIEMLGYASRGEKFLALTLLLSAFFLWRGSRKSWKTVRTMQPINYANTADLPAPDSLVRASQEPAQAQESILLRAATGEAQSGQEGQLLRASVGRQE